MGFFGNLDLGLKQLLVLAYREFRGWCKRERIACSQPVFTPGLVCWLAILVIQPIIMINPMRTRSCIYLNRVVNSVKAKVLKKSGDILLAAKAYNNRIILEWLANCLRTSLDAGAYADPRLPLATCAMWLPCNYNPD